MAKLQIGKKSKDLKNLNLRLSKKAIKEIKRQIAEENPDALFCDGLDQALVGVGRQFPNHTVAVYDKSLCIKTLMKQNDWEFEEAIEWLEFNTFQAGMGEDTPIFTQALTGDPDSDMLF